MKRLIALSLLLCFLTVLLTACVSKTPDVVAAEDELTLENLDWSISLEGCDKGVYTLADAQAHELAKGIVSMWIIKSDSPEDSRAAVMTSMIIEGIPFTEFLADVGREDATEVTFSGKDIYGEPFSYTMTSDSIYGEKTLLGWICNKESLLPDSENHVGIVDGSNRIADFGNCLSVDHIIIK